MRYIISDTHHGHSNIIEYCDRPFDSVEEMDEHLIDAWNDKVGSDDTVLFLGDVCHGSAGLSPNGYLEKLNGQILVVRGNHDSGLSQNNVVNVVESCTIQHGRWKFYCSHRPVDDTNFWNLHGHRHDNAPFVQPQKKKVNVSVEVIGYEPLRMDKLISILEEKKRRERLNCSEVKR